MPVLIQGLIFLVILIAGHELGHFLAAKAFRLRVDEFGIGFPPRLVSRKKGETRYSVNLLPFGGFVKIHGEHAKEGEALADPRRSYIHQPAWKRAVIIISGVFMNFLIGWIAFSIVFSAGLPTRLFIEEVLPESPAEEAGLMAGDVIEDFSSAEEFLVYIDEHRGEEIEVNNRTIVPRETPPGEEGPLGIVLFESGVESQGILKSVNSGFQGAAKTVWLIAKAFGGFIAGILTGNFETIGQVTGPVGIFGLLGDTARLGIAPLVQFLGIISLNLVVINLIPFPALDGGRFLFLLIEKTIGRRFSPKAETLANSIGLVLLLLLMVIVTVRDIINVL